MKLMIYSEKGQNPQTYERLVCFISLGKQTCDIYNLLFPLGQFHAELYLSFQIMPAKASAGRTCNTENF